MPRPVRLQIPSGVYHVCVRGNRGAEIVLHDADRRVWLATLADAQRRCGWSIYGYSLLDNHFHLLVRTPHPNLAAGMQYLGGAYAVRFNHANGLTGHLQQGRYLSKLVTTEEYALELIRYIALNARRAGLCKRAEAWQWASYPALLGLVSAEPLLTVDWTLRRFDDDDRRARIALRTFVDSAPNTTSEIFPRPSLGDVLGAPTGEALRAARRYGYTISEIADHLGISLATAYRRLQA